jgi:signal peptidase II
MESKSKKRIFGILLMVMLVLLDQLTKELAIILLKGKESFVLIKDVFELEYLENTGAAFSMLEGKTWFFLILTVVIVIAAFVIYFKTPLSGRFFWFRLTLVFLISGAIGNFIDRAAKHYVVDFFYFKLINFPIFNVADIYVTCAEVLLIILVLFYYKSEDFEEIFHGK